MKKIVRQTAILTGGLLATLITARLAGVGAAYYMGLLEDEED